MDLSLYIYVFDNRMQCKYNKDYIQIGSYIRGSDPND